MESQINTKYIKRNYPNRLCQGDILKNVEILIASDFDNDSKEYTRGFLTLQYCVLINQECDLLADYNARVLSNSAEIKADKILPSILLLPAYHAEQFKQGIHLPQREKWNSDQFRIIKQNNNSRFHYIEAFEDLQIPEMIIDFKHLYTITANIVNKRINDFYLASINELYRESLSQRYCNYLRWVLKIHFFSI